MPNFNPGSIAVIVGATGAIGKAFLQKLLYDDAFIKIYAICRNIPNPVEDMHGDKIEWLEADITDQRSIASCVATIHKQYDAIHLLFIATGILHNARLKPEKRLQDVKMESLTEAFQVNAAGPLLMAQAFAPMMDRDKPAVIAAISARVGSISDNRKGGWYAYRASKAALNMLFKTLALELARTTPNTITVLLHPGTTDSKLSAPFQRHVPSGQLFSPEKTAAYLLSVIVGLENKDTGHLFAWDGTPIEW